MRHPPRHNFSVQNSRRKRGGKFRHRPRSLSPALTFIGAAALVGALIGTATIATEKGGLAAIVQSIRSFSAPLGPHRARLPQTGDHWRRCDDARAAGTAPIYIGEPGYRAELDSDGDGFACEPYRGM
jgi:hypothetical protein